ncbi:hypothetical protein DPMN_054800 [Dreissena polymorpha]|uniref:Uncharacterized protein n=1 Tax=Dreissena polymorpha TaxID=45954 RepID=A0A9D4CNS2_DREPO|nr:hypothetical protein DPMN_054800 [Dreissena polymorpha]
MSDISLREASLTDELYGNTDLDEFISTLIQPDEQFLKIEQAAVDSLVRLLQQDIPAKIRPARVLKAGSLGKGTAVKGKENQILI